MRTIIPPSTKTLSGIRAHAKAIADADGRYEIQMLCKMVSGLADYIDSLEVETQCPHTHKLRSSQQTKGEPPQ